MASEYQLGWRTGHSTVVIDNTFYCWGGEQKHIPKVHDNKEKQKITSSIDLFHLSSFKWERRPTTGTPPAGVRDYACTDIENNIFYYGGCCKPGDCYHNNLYKLNSLNNNWREVVNSTPDNVPMKKIRCGMISYKINGKYNLLLLGGYGPVPVTTHSHSQYIPDPNIPNLCFTNEVHMMCVTSSPGQWIVPVITGTRPPPCAGFTMHTLHNNKCVMFGGDSIDETGVHTLDDLYIFSCTHNTIDFQKVVKSTVNWPKKMSFHASTIINTISNKVVTSHLIISGGLDEYGNTLNNFWIMQSSSFIWYKINLPESVVKRFDHFMTSYEISNGHVWLVVTGGSRNTSIVITGSDVTFIVELVYSDDEWMLKRIWNSEQNWYKTEEMILREKWSIDLREKDMKLILLQSSESSLKYTIDMLNKQLQESQKLLEVQKKISLVKSQELEDSKKQITLLKKTLTHTSTISSDEETIQDYQKPQEAELFEEKQSKPVDEDKSVISDKTLIALEENESLQKIVISKNEQVEELQSMLETKEQRIKELESIQEQVIILKTKISDKSSQVEKLQNTLEKNEVELQIQREQVKKLETTIQEMEENRKISSLVLQSSSDIIPLSDDPGLHIAKEKVFHIKGNTLDWGDYGFKMNFPEGTIPPSQVIIKALVGGKFQFPDEVELVSALYVIQFPENFLQPVVLEIQHCVYLKSSRQFKNLSFVIAPIDESVPPYKFQFIEGGKFYTDCQYGMIVRSKFSITGIVLKSNGDSVHTSSDEEEQSPSDPSSDTDNVDAESTGSTDSSSEDKNPTSNTTHVHTTSGVSGHDTSDSLPAEDKKLTSDTSGEIQTTFEHVDVHSTDNDVSNIDDIEVREDISSDNEEIHEEVKHKSIDGISAENIITSPDVQEEKSHENAVITNYDDIINTPCTNTRTKETSSINYGGKIFYESRGKNKWLMRFIAVKDLNALSKYVLKHHPQAEVDQSVSFKFSYDSYYLELIMDKKQEKPFNEWVISPHTKLCKLSKLSMDMFGRSDSYGIPDPPSCLVSVYADNEQKAAKLLSYAVPLKGVVSLEEEIFITRFLETTDTSRTVQQFGSPSKPTGNDLTQADPHQLVECIKRVFDQNYSSLGSLFEDSIDIIASEMLQAGLISRHVAKKPTFHLLINDFTSGIVFMRKTDKIINHIIKFLRVLLEMQGPFVFAAEQLKEDIHDIINSRLGIELNLNV